MGGTCTNDGRVPTRVLAKAARLMRDAGLFEAFGLVGDGHASGGRMGKSILGNEFRND